MDYEAYCGLELHPPAGAEMSPVELATALQERPAPVVLDVREPWEWEIARIAGSRLLPLGQLPSRLAELEAGAEIVTVCHRGKRSLQAQQLLQGAGFRARSLAGGIDAWASEVEPGMPRY
jgi:rhodanese-related sulfurtransferase